jgi:hypothetical protein
MLTRTACRKPRLLNAACVMLVLLCACAESHAGSPAPHQEASRAAADAGSSNAGIAGHNTVDAGQIRPMATDASEPVASKAVVSKSPDAAAVSDDAGNAPASDAGVSLRTCVSAASYDESIAQTLRVLIAECNTRGEFICGVGMLTFHATGGIDFSGMLNVALVDACVHGKVGHERWSCAMPNAMVSVRIASCTR